MTKRSVLAASWRDRRAARRRIRAISAALGRAYGTPPLGNLADPLSEAVFILLTFQTDIPRARKVWRALRRRFPGWEDVFESPSGELESLLRPSGLQRSRARLIRKLLHHVKDRFGELSLEGCRGMSSESLERELMRLPGLGRKGARCVMLYSFGRAVFPVDSNTHRFARRFGILASHAPYRNASVQDGLQEIVMPALRRKLHVNLVVHGQRTCTPVRPHCDHCVLRRGCQTA